MGTAQPLETSLIEVSTGQAKYEHAYKAVVWRVPRLPKEGQGGALGCCDLVLRGKRQGRANLAGTASEHALEGIFVGAEMCALGRQGASGPPLCPGAYTTQLFLLRLDLTSFDQIPASFEQFVAVEFSMPATSVSHTTVRSISVSNENPPEKYVRYLSKHEYRVEIELQTGELPPSETEISSLASAAQQAPSYEPTAPTVAAAAAAGAKGEGEEDDSD